MIQVQEIRQDPMQHVRLFLIDTPEGTSDLLASTNGWSGARWWHRHNSGLKLEDAVELVKLLSERGLLLPQG